MTLEEEIALSRDDVPPVGPEWPDVCAPLVDALQHVIVANCENFTRGTCLEDERRRKGAYYTAFRWCQSCIARDGLERARKLLCEGA